VGSIGREIAREIEKYFEAKVNPETIKSKALRIKSASKMRHSNQPFKKTTKFRKNRQKKKEMRAGNFRKESFFELLLVLLEKVSDGFF